MENCLQSQENSGSHANCNDPNCDCNCVVHQETKANLSLLTRANVPNPSDKEIVKSELIESFNAVLQKAPKEILAFLFCNPPEKLFHEMNNDEKQDFLHFYQEVEKKARIISQSATIAYQQFEKDQNESERERLSVRDRAYKVKPLETKIKVSSEERLKTKIADDLRKMGLSDDDIIAILNKKGL